MHEAGVKSTQVKAVAVANGPGSYTGLRVGLAAAKGLCFAWNLPLITLCSLKIMAKAVCLIRDFNMEQMGSAASIAVLVDARRMEVFYGVFNTSTLGVEEGPAAREVNNEFLLNFYSKGQLLCTGNGCAKWLNLVMHEAITYVELPPTEVAFAKLSSEAFTKKDYADLPYSEPFYIKPFYSTAKRS
jgi:tRNA threonylcarbamoyladenosine biosynthesis protein TsaB